MKKRTKMHHNATSGSVALELAGYQTMHPAAAHKETYGQYHLEGALLDTSSPQIVINESRFAKIVRSVFG